MDWELAAPGILLSGVGLAGVAVSYAGISATFQEGLHSAAAMALAVGIIMLVAGLIKGGFPTGPGAKVAIGLTLAAVMVGGEWVATTAGFSIIPPAPAVRPPSTVPRPPAAQVVSVSIVEGAVTPNSVRNFVPKVVTVVIGVNNTVEWSNDEGIPHTVTSDAHGGFNKPTPDKQYDAAATKDNWLFDLGSKYRYTFTVPGTYTYHCAPHPWMTGTIIVKAGS